MMESWEQVQQWLQNNAPEIANSLRPPASEGDLAELGKYTQHVDILDYLRVNDGQKSFDLSFIFPGYVLLSCKGITDEIKSDRDLIQECIDLEYTFDPPESIPPGFIRPDFKNPHWIPIASDIAGAYIYIDLDPDELGTKGQVILWCVDTTLRYVISQSLNEFYLHLERLLVSGDVGIEVGFEGKICMVWKRPHATSFWEKSTEIHNRQFVQKLLPQ